MKETNKRDEDFFLLSLSDFFSICKKSKYSISMGIVICAILGGFYALNKPIQYTAEATFKEKANGAGVSSQSLASMIFSDLNGKKDSDSLTLMKSRKIVGELVQNLGIQAVLTPKKQKNRNKILDNLRVMRAYQKNSVLPSLPDAQQALSCHDIVYGDEIPLDLKVVFISEEDYQLIGKDGEEIGKGRLGVPFAFKDISFTLDRDHQHLPLANEEYYLTLLPLHKEAEGLSKQIIVEPHSQDKSLIMIKYLHHDRHYACKVVNTLMHVYQNYLKSEQSRVFSEQLDYLHQCKEEMLNKLKNIMSDYAEGLSQDVSTIGYLDSQSAIDFLLRTQENYKGLLLEIELKIKRLQKGDRSTNDDEAMGPLPKEHLLDVDFMTIIDEQIRELNQASDAVDLALRNYVEESPNERKDIFIQQFEDLRQVQECLQQAQQLLVDVNEENTKSIPAYDVLFQNPKYLAKVWFDQLVVREIDVKNASPSEKNAKNLALSRYKDNFQSYLLHLIHLLNVHKASLKERLTHQQSPQLEFEGIDLPTANTLYVNYQEQINTLDAKLLREKFCLHRLQEDPAFEISSLNAVLSDVVSGDMLQKASQLVLTLRDQNYRTPKEQERIKAELDLYRGFLQMHLQQTIELSELHKKMLRDKIHRLQNEFLALYQQRISILEEQRSNYLDSYLGKLEVEKDVLQKHLSEINQEMATLPQKRVAENLIEYQRNTNQKIVEEITKLVESKHISSNLDTIQSAPFDYALPPLHPAAPKLMAYILLGGFLGGFFALFVALTRSVIKGVPATKENLKLAQQHVSGCLSRSCSEENLVDNDLATLRRLLIFLEQNENLSQQPVHQAQSLLLLQGKGCDYSQALAMLLSKKGSKILLLSLCFDQSTNQQDLPGLLQVIEGTAQEPKIQHKPAYDLIASGGISRFSSELIGSNVFKSELNKLKENYDWIIGISSAMPNSAEAESLFSHFNQIVVTVVDETLQDVRSCILMKKESGKNISFIVSSCNS